MDYEQLEAKDITERAKGISSSTATLLLNRVTDGTGIAESLADVGSAIMDNIDQPGVIPVMLVYGVVKALEKDTSWRASQANYLTKGIHTLVQNRESISDYVERNETICFEQDLMKDIVGQFDFLETEDYDFGAIPDLEDDVENLKSVIAYAAEVQTQYEVLRELGKIDKDLKVENGFFVLNRLLGLMLENEAFNHSDDDENLRLNGINSFFKETLGYRTRLIAEDYQEKAPEKHFETCLQFTRPAYISQEEDSSDFESFESALGFREYINVLRYFFLPDPVFDEWVKDGLKMNSHHDEFFYNNIVQAHSKHDVLRLIFDCFEFVNDYMDVDVE